MSMTRTLIAGIGSPHGDDQAGWRVIEALQRIASTSCRLLQVVVPHALLDQLDESVSALHVIDACLATAQDQPCQRYTMACSRGGSATDRPFSVA